MGALWAIIIAGLVSLPTLSWGAGKGPTANCYGACPSFYVGPRLGYHKQSVTFTGSTIGGNFLSDTAVGMEAQFELLGGPDLSVFFFIQ